MSDPQSPLPPAQRNDVYPAVRRDYIQFEPSGRHEPCWIIGVLRIKHSFVPAPVSSANWTQKQVERQVFTCTRCIQMRPSRSRIEDIFANDSYTGGVKSDMTLSALHPDVDKMQEGFSERIRRVYESFDQTPELCAQTCVYLAAGRDAALRGRHIDVGDDIEDLVRQADVIRSANMYDLGVKTLGG